MPAKDPEDIDKQDVLDHMRNSRESLEELAKLLKESPELRNKPEIRQALEEYWQEVQKTRAFIDEHGG